jgi:transposase
MIAIVAGLVISLGATLWVLQPVIARAPRATSRMCPTCGPRPESDARYCSNCGTVLRG